MLWCLCWRWFGKGTCGNASAHSAGVVAASGQQSIILQGCVSFLFYNGVFI